MEISVKVPGKIIIGGEHAVVHGYPALACAVSIFSHCDIESIDSPYIIIKLENYTKSFFGKSVKSLRSSLGEQFPLIHKGLELIENKCNISITSIYIKIRSEYRYYICYCI